MYCFTTKHGLTSFVKQHKTLHSLKSKGDFYYEIEKGI